MKLNFGILHGAHLIRYYFSFKLSNTDNGDAACSPASIGISVPDIHLDSSLAKNITAQATSHAVPSVPNGPAFLLNSLRSSVISSDELGKAP